MVMCDPISAYSCSIGKPRSVELVSGMIIPESTLETPGQHSAWRHLGAKDYVEDLKGIRRNLRNETRGIEE